MKHRSSAPSPHKHWFHTRPQTCPEDFSSPKKHVRVSCWRELPLQREARCSLDKIYTQAAKMSCLIKDEACCFEEGGVVFLFTWMSKNKTLLSLKTKLTEDLTCSMRLPALPCHKLFCDQFVWGFSINVLSKHQQKPHSPIESSPHWAKRRWEMKINDFYLCPKNFQRWAREDMRPAVTSLWHKNSSPWSSPGST